LNWLGENEQALNAALSALDVDPHYATALAVLGEIYTDEGNVAKAEDYLKQAQAIDPKNVTMLRNWAYLYQRRQQYDEAIKAYDAALAVAPVRFDLFLEKGLLYRVSLADYKNANAAYDRAVRLYKSPVTLDYYGEGLYNSDDPLQAVRVLREAIQMDPNYGPAQAHLGMALFIRHNYEDAVEPLEKGINLLGDKARVEQLYTLGLAYIYKEPSDCDKAAFWLNKALVMAPGNSIALSGLNNLKNCQSTTDTMTSTKPSP
jgi:tetratricopeptide (TPR) repeat protein